MLLLISCSKDKAIPTGTGYPDTIADLVYRNCATTGCHTQEDKLAAAGLSLETWSDMMEGANNYNAVVVPYRSDFSTIHFFINTDEGVGPVIQPTMPFGADPFSAEEVQRIADWINQGAPNDVGEVAFSSNSSSRNKAYVLNSLCDDIAVIDDQSGLIMRYISASSGGGAFPEEIEVTPDGEHLLVLHQTGELKRFSCATDTKSGQLNLGTGFWRSMTLSANSQYAFVANWSGNSAYSGGNITVVDVNSLTVIANIDAPSDSIYFPYGPVVAPDGNTLYAASTPGNYLYKVDISDLMNPQVSKVMLQAGETQQLTGNPYRPGRIVFSPDGSKYYVICQRTEELRVYQSSNDSLLTTISVGLQPERLCFAEPHGVAILTCTEDQSIFASGKGAVFLIDYNTDLVINTLYTGYQPQGVVYSPDRDWVYVSNRNADPVGADAPHHYTECEGNNGYVTVIDLSTMNLLPDYKVEVSVDPYDIAFRRP